MEKGKKIFFLILAASCLIPVISPAIALFTGIIFAFVFKNPFEKQSGLISKKLLQYSVIGLGFGMNLSESLKAGSEGMLFTILSVSLTMALGMLFGFLLKVPKTTSYLLSSGTAICGGSAIAAIAPVTSAKQSEITVALGTIFILNAIALFIFPPIGKLLELTEQQFGYFAAIAIHDTSSVVGAASIYGNSALEIATLVKLTRALWIIPLVLLTRLFFKNKSNKNFIPYFIFFFILAMLLNTLFSSYLQIPYWKEIAFGIKSVSKQCLTLTLFLIGANLNPTMLKQVGIKPLLLGILLWIVIAATSLVFVRSFA
jgi:uncharacterized integral membrane protein (TIGR00698 family)